MQVIAIVPVDDAHSMRWQIGGPQGQGAGPRRFGKIGPAYAPHPDAGYLPDQGGFMGKWRLVQNKANDYLIDREMQAEMRSWSGIMGIGDQDHAVVESMGDIYGRTKEHLATSDMMVIRMRRMLLENARALREHGTPPKGVDDPTAYRARSGGIILPNGINGLEATAGLQRGEPLESMAMRIPVENHGV
jgi:hypothetical protein